MLRFRANRNVKELHCVLNIGVPFIEVSSERCTSGRVSGRNYSEEHTWGKPS